MNISYSETVQFTVLNVLPLGVKLTAYSILVRMYWLFNNNLPWYSSIMTQFLPPNLLALFAPRDPLPYLPPVEKLPHEKKTHGYSGVAAFLDEFEDPQYTPPPRKVETREERLERRRRERAEQVAYKLEQEIALCKYFLVFFYYLFIVTNFIGTGTILHSCSSWN